MSGVASLSARDPLQVGPYRTMGRLGVGGMGVVYLATGPTGDRVALKVMRDDLADQPSFRTRFAREVHAARAVAGAHTARLIDADAEASPQWIASEYIPGPTLSEHIDAHGPLSEEQVRLLGRGLAEAIEAIHDAGLIHRDLKPGNIILTTDGPKVIDFGITHDANATNITQTGDYVGSLAWMTPEQITGSELNPASDVFAWGLVVAYAALGQHPFGEGRAEAIAFRIVHQQPDLTDLPDAFRAAVHAALAIDPQQRPTPPALVASLSQSQTTVEDITRVMSASWDATIAGPPRALAAPGPAEDGNADTDTPPRLRRRRRGLALGGAIALIAAGAAAFIALGLPLLVGDDGAEAVSSNEYPLLVDTTLAIRSGPYLGAEEIGRLTSSDLVVVQCTTQGDPVQQADSIVNDQWNRVTAPVAGWVADAFIDTGSSPAPQPLCEDVPTREAAIPANDNSAWPDLQYAGEYEAFITNDATRDTPPEFPTKVSGYQLSYEATVTSRAFEDALTPVLEVPATMNGCANQRFNVRWRPINEDATIEALWTYPSPQTDEYGYLVDPLIADEGGAAVGVAGWMSSYGCTIPAFRVAGLPGTGNLSDVVVEFQVWTPGV